jgi:FAS-associated factor 2
VTVPAVSLAMPGAYHEEAEPITPNPNRSSFNSESINQVFVRLINRLYLILIKPMIWIMILCFRVLAKLINVVYFTDHYIEDLNIQGNHTRDPIDKVNKFIRDLEDNLTPQQLTSENYLPPFFQGSYTQALYMATHRAKFLFVYLTNPQNENSSSMFKKIITSPHFVSLFSRQDILIWGGDLTNPEAYQLANTLNVTRFPFLGLLCLTRTTNMTPQGPTKASPKISLILKLQGGFSDDVDENTLIQNKFYKKIAKYEEDLMLMRNELRDKFMSQVLLKQQEMNYQNSLAKDKAKKIEKNRQHLIKQYLIHRAEYFRNIRHNKIQENVSKLAIKLLSGTRVSINFPADSKVEEIYIFVELLNRDYLDNENLTSTLTDEEATEKFRDLKIDYSFTLSSPLPPRTSLNEKREEIIRNIDSIYPNGLLIVEDK